MRRYTEIDDNYDIELPDGTIMSDEDLEEMHVDPALEEIFESRCVASLATQEHTDHVLKEIFKL